MPPALACLRVLVLALLATSPSAAIAHAGRICTARGRLADEIEVCDLGDQTTASWMSFSPVAASTT
ncbi:hypothetical protein [Amaricoccus sp.]|uniref:hypothetical protein n=1 Tax=Amaricoccus sp. TaxID=1872485 RepID=UPI001B40D6EB|nr:hypothetical protein [Amaricoccus sp.]MBP7001216.1 hypothetical protein [Amaricoccus sp.]